MSCEAGDVDGDDEAGIIVYSRFRDPYSGDGDSDASSDPHR